MSKKNTFLLIFLSSLLLSFTLPPKREEPLHLTTSVIIPCVAYHSHHLMPLLTYYAEQTCLPDEIIISLSETEKLSNDEPSRLQNASWPFRLIVIPHEKRKSAGVNRNIACARSSGDILLFQDADDIPHPQRVEIVKYLFENYEIEHLTHTWIPEGKYFSPCDRDQLDLRRYNNFRDIDVPYTHFGNICLSARIMFALRWDDAIKEDHDVKFNLIAYSLFPNTAVLVYPLVQYRQPLSAFVHHLSEKEKP